MESPATWNLLTASISVCDPKRPREAWVFLAVQGLVDDSGDGRAAFAEAVREESARDHTGPSLAMRVASALQRAGLVRPGAETPDPWGRTAARRLEAIASWGPNALGSEGLENTRKWLELAAEQLDAQD